MSDNKEKISWKFYTLLSGAAIGLIGGMYFLYSLFSNDSDIEMSNDQKEKLDELIQLSQTINESESPNQKKNSESAFAIKIFKQINELSEEMFSKEHTNWILKRRELLRENKKIEYNSFCENILGEKMRIESIAADMILNRLGMSQIELQGMMENIPQKDFMELQQQMMQKQQLQNNGNKNPDSISNEKIIEAFKEFLKIKAELDNESKNMQQFMNDYSEEAKMQFFLRLEINKYIIDDNLYNSFEIDFSQLMMIINSRQLFTNSEISSEYQKLIQEFNQAY